MAIQKTEAYLLRTQPFRTSSLVVTSFSRSFGKLRGLAKGVRKEGVSHPSAFEPFTLVELVFYEKIRSDLHLVTEISVLESFEALRRNLKTLATAYYLAELVDQLTEPHDPHERVFDLLGFCFQKLTYENAALLSRYFEFQLLQEVGLAPHLDACLNCDEKNLKQPYFSVRQGAVFCEHCRKKAPEAARLRPELLKLMQVLATRGALESGEGGIRSLAELDRVVVLEEMGGLVERFLTDRLSKQLLTRRFLSQIHRLKIRPTMPSREASPQS